MSEPTRRFKSNWEKLVQERDESDIRATLRELLEEAGLGRFKMEDDAGSGPADLKSRQYKTIIETKGRGLAGPRRPGSGRHESQREQLERYLDDVTVKDPKFVPSNVLWRGCITDGIDWWIYEAIPGGGIRNLQDQHIRHIVHCSSESDLWDLLTKTIGPAHRQGLPPPPDDLAERVFAPFVEDMHGLALDAEGTPAYGTKFAVWEQALRGAGIVPPKTQPGRKTLLFAKHTTLVAAARILKLVLGNQNVGSKRAIDEVGSGFPAWLPQAQGGTELIVRMSDRLKEFDWRGETRDRLKEAYHGLIEVKERKEFGEYYTPDWLARKVVEEVLDGEWMDEAITRAADFVEGTGGREADLTGLGVLDPACGSGTFLFHAAQRLQARMVTAHPGLVKNARAILVRLVMGIDTHPIAVEMAKATFEMALPPGRPARGGTDMEPQVFLGDAMQSLRHGYRDLTEGSGQVEILSPGGRMIPVPLELLLRPDADRLINRLVDAAHRDRDVRFTGLGGDTSKKDVGETRKALTGVIVNEANHVWGWHLRNVAGPIRVSENRVGRIVTNPPWLVSNDTPEGDRKKVLARLRADYGLKAGLRGSSAKGDLAATFTARIADLYLDSGGRMGLVLPGSALINQTWASWRTGQWGPCNVVLTKAWELSDLDPPPFDHAPNGTSAVFGQRSEDARPLAPETVGYWKGYYDHPDVTVRKHIERKPSAYESRVMRGALAEPHALLYVHPSEVRSSLNHDGCVDVTTVRSTKGKWANKSLLGTLEKEVLEPIVTPKGLEAFAAQSDMFLIVPSIQEQPGHSQRRILDLTDKEFRQTLPHTHEFWVKASKIYVDNRSEKAAKTLSGNLDYKGTLSNQFGGATGARAKRRKVVYNKSGSKRIRAARIPLGLIVNGSLYYLVANNEDEALYLCGILNADCMQAAWIASKTARLHFDKNPWRAVPIPRFDASVREHLAVLRAARAAEGQMTEKTSHRLDNAVARLLPDYAEIAN